MPTDPVSIAPASTQQAAAIVVPLLSTTRDQGQPRLSGLVSFLRDCSGRAYYSAVDDLVAHSATMRSFPAVTMETAIRRLGVSTPQLVYSTTPFAPRWRNGVSGATIPAE